VAASALDGRWLADPSWFALSHRHVSGELVQAIEMRVAGANPLDLVIVYLLEFVERLCAGPALDDGDALAASRHVADLLAIVHL
jgi:hypothetical protein